MHTVESLAYASKKDLVAIKGLSEAKVEKIQSQGATRVAMPAGSFVENLTSACGLQPGRSCPWASRPPPWWPSSGRT